MSSFASFYQTYTLKFSNKVMHCKNQRPESSRESSRVPKVPGFFLRSDGQFKIIGTVVLDIPDIHSCSFFVYRIRAFYFIENSGQINQAVGFNKFPALEMFMVRKCS